MPVDEALKGVIWCPGCDSVLKWRLNEDDQKQLTDESYSHLETHGYRGSRMLKDPVVLAVHGDGVHDEGAEDWLLADSYTSRY